MTLNDVADVLTDGSIEARICEACTSGVRMASECLGRHLTEREARIVISAVIRHFLSPDNSTVN